MRVRHAMNLDSRAAGDAPATVAVLVPCLDEEAAVAGVVADFRAVLPSATVYVYDNGSGDDTVGAARRAGAVVRLEAGRGKGNVVRRMFGDVDADVYVLVDGDGTYPAAEAPRMVAALVDGPLDMVCGARVASGGGAFRAGHRLGNAFFTRLVGWIFGRRFEDVLTGYRVLSRRFVKSFPACSTGFEIETEMAAHAARMRMPVAELRVSYGERDAGAPSKLRTVRDGFAIARTIAHLAREERPLAFHGAAGVLLECAAVALAWPVLPGPVESDPVPPSTLAVAAAACAVLGALSFACGLVLDTVSRGRREVRRLRYLAIGAPPGETPGRSGAAAAVPDAGLSDGAP